jgi:hypothetical protein
MLAESLNNENYNVLYINFGDTPVSDSRIASEILYVIQDETIVLIDDLQSSPAGAELALGAIALRKANPASRNKSITIAAASWPEYGSKAAKLLPSFRSVPIISSNIANRIVGAPRLGFSDETRHFLLEKYKDDLWLLSQAITILANQDILPDTNTLGTVITKDLLDRAGVNNDAVDDVKRVLLVLSTLGMYDIAAPQNAVSRIAKVNQEHVERLVRQKICRSNGDYIRLGHRSLCKIVYGVLSGNPYNAWQILNSINGAADKATLVADYLELLTTSQVISSIRAICARARYRDASALDVSSQRILSIWTTFNALLEKLQQQQDKDATWGATPSSCMFACEAFTATGNSSTAVGSLMFLRDIYSLDSGTLSIDFEKLSTKVDFSEIAKRVPE